MWDLALRGAGKFYKNCYCSSGWAIKKTKYFQTNLYASFVIFTCAIVDRSRMIQDFIVEVQNYILNQHLCCNLLDLLEHHRSFHLQDRIQKQESTGMFLFLLSSPAKIWVFSPYWMIIGLHLESSSLRQKSRQGCLWKNNSYSCIPTSPFRATSVLRGKG